MIGDVFGELGFIVGVRADASDIEDLVKDDERSDETLVGRLPVDIEFLDSAIRLRLRSCRQRCRSQTANLRAVRSRSA